MDIAATADGLCPLCSQAEIERLRAEVDWLNEQIGTVRAVDRAATIEECAQITERGILPWDESDFARHYREAAAAIRALAKDSK
jgi:hypothetical protein